MRVAIIETLIRYCAKLVVKWIRSLWRHSRRRRESWKRVWLIDSGHCWWAIALSDAILLELLRRLEVVDHWKVDEYLIW